MSSQYHRTELSPSFQHGVTLLEVLVSLIVLSIALLATARMHALVTVEGSYAKVRAAAANLAQEKLDDLRAFTVLYDSSPSDGVDACAAPVYCFTEMADDTGGAETAGGTRVLPSGSVTVANTTFNRSWTVEDYYACTAGEVATTANCTSAKDYPDYKRVTVTVGWTDEKGSSQSIVMGAVIYAFDPAMGGRSLSTNTQSAIPQPSYTPVGVPDAVPVPVSTGSGQKKESSKPEPDVNTSGVGAEVSFDAVSYTESGAGFVADEREEFTTVTCECGFTSDSSNFTEGPYTPGRMVWTGSKLVSRIGETVDKAMGIPSGNSQSSFCTACCRDHHDTSDSGYPKYNPVRDSGNYNANGDHKHYWYSQCVSGTTGETTGCSTSEKNGANGYGEVTSGAYLESCRFKRVEGYWRVWQDWNLRKLTVFPYDFLTVEANLNSYVDVIEAVVENAIRTDSGNGTTAIPTLTGRDVTFTAEGESEQLLGRGVYVDTVYQNPDTATSYDPGAVDSDYYSELVARISSDDDWLTIVPFYEANLTLLIDWASSNTSKFTVTSQDIVDITDVSNGYYSSFSRGRVTAIAAGNADITATARLYNSGVTGGISTSSPSYGISVADNTGALNDSINASLAGTPGSVGISGSFQYANDSVDLGTVNVSTSIGTCTLQTASGNQRPFSCTVSSGSSPRLTYSSSASGYSFSPASENFSNVTSAVTAQTVTVYGPTVKISGTVTATGGGAKLDSVSATGGATCTVAPGGKSSYTCTASRGATGYTGTITFSATGSASPAQYTFSGQQADVTNMNVSVTR